MSLKPCIACGEPGSNARCTDCQTAHDAKYTRKSVKVNASERGYDRRWRVLSERARRIQPWCTDCGTPDRLTGDHSPEAWERKAKGLPIRLRDIDVVCQACNNDRGSARPGGMRSTVGAATRAGQAESASIASDSH